MTHTKDKFKPGEAYVAFCRVITLEKLHIINYTQSQIHVSEHVEKEMQRLRKSILPQMPSNLFQNVPGGVKLPHLNIGNFKRKIEDMKHDDIFKNSDISLNETHLGHSDTLTPDIMGISKDKLIVCCDFNNRAGGVSLIVNRKLNPKQIRMTTILEIVAVKISGPIQMVVVSVYRPPSTPSNVFMNHMLEIFAQFQHIPTCIVGDFNEDVSVTSNTCYCAMCVSDGKYNANRCHRLLLH